MKALLSIVLLIVAYSNVTAQNGTLHGTVTDENLKAIPSATITVTGKVKRNLKTDTSGKFSISLPAGKFTINVTSIAYTSQSAEISIEEGKEQNLNIALKPAQSELGTVVVSRRRDRESEAVLNLERKNSNQVVLKVGAKELARKGVSNVAEGLNKVTGVSIVGGQQLFIRGLGDRYNNAMLNGLPVPSPNPDFKVIPLDLFPTGIVKNLSVLKSYSADYYGDFSGGTIDIATKDYPSEKFFTVNVSTGINTLITGKDFLAGKKGFPTFSGFTRSDRALPSDVKDGEFYSSAGKDVQKNPFSVSFSPTKMTAPPKVGLSFSGGDLIRGGNGSEFGYIFNLAYKNGYYLYSGIDRLLNANEVDLFTNTLTSYRYNTNTSALGGIYFKPNSRNQFNYNVLFVNDSQDEVVDIDGINPDLGPVFTRLYTNIQNSILVNQLHGRHDLNDRLKLKWSGSFGITKGSLPDRTQISLLNDGPEVADRRFFFNKDVLGNNHKLFGELNENETAGKVELSYSRERENPRWFLAQLSGGIDAKYKTRKFEARQIDIRTTSIRHAVNPDNIDTTLNVDRMGDGFQNNTWAFVETYYPSNNYDANIFIAAPYLSANIAISQKLDLFAGVRAEYSDQNINYKQSNDTYDRELRNFSQDKLDVLPFLTLKYRRTEKNNILFSASRSLTRPLFLELAPFRFNQGFNRLPREGNPFLVASENYNADLKFELYPTKSELMALTVFGKYIKNPIEQFLVISSDRLTSFFNIESAVLFGAELEINRNIASLTGLKGQFFKNLGLGLNAAYLHSETSIDPKKVKSFYNISPTNEKRPMYGASPYLVNVDLNYRHSWSPNSFTQATVTYNVYGKRIVFAGSFNAGDVYEMPAPTLDFVLNNQLTKRLSLDISLGNIINPSIRQEQFFGGKGTIINEYKRGMNASIGIGYNF